MIEGIIFDFNRTIYDPRVSGPSRGAIELLESLYEDYKLCLVSCLISGISKEERCEQIVSLWLNKYFKFIQVIEGEKTIADFRECLRIMELEPQKVLVVGDRVTSEICLGNQLAMTTVWYKSGKFSTLKPENELQEPDHTIIRLDEVKQYLAGKG